MEIKVFPKLFVLLALAFFFSFGIYSRCLAFGVSPPWVKSNHLLPGSVYKQQVTLSRYKPTTDLKAVIVYDKLPEELKGWISVEEGDEFILPKGESQVPIHFIVEVPDSAALKRYQGTVTVKTRPSREGAGVGIALAAGIHIDLTVTDQEVEDMLVRYVNIKKVEEGRPIPFLMKIENRGNIPTNPDKVEIQVYDQYHKKMITEGSTTRMEEIPPFETRTITANVPVKLKLGTYWAEFKIWKNDQILREGRIVFNVVERQPTFLEKIWLYVWGRKQYFGPALAGVVLVSVLVILSKKGKLHIRIELGGSQPAVNKKKEEKSAVRIRPTEKG